MKFTPEVLLSAPRRSAGVPNPSGTRILYTSSTYDFGTHKKTIELRLLDVATNDSHLLATDDEVSDFNWLDDGRFFCLQAEKDGTTSLYAADVSKVPDSPVTHYVVEKIPTSASNLKICKLDAKGYELAVVVSAQALLDGSLLTPQEAKKKTQATGRLYSKLYVRHWDHYVDKARNALFTALMRRGEDGKYRLSGLTNALKGSGLECPMGPFGGTDNFDIRRTGLIFVAKDPELNVALGTKCNVYLLNMKSWGEVDSAEIEEIPISGYEGAATCPVFATDGTKGAFLMMKGGDYEADKNAIFVLSDVSAQASRPRSVLMPQEASTIRDSFWDHSPQAIVFSADGKSLLVVAEDKGTASSYDVQLIFNNEPPRPALSLTTQGYVSDIKALSNGRVFLSGSTLVDNSWYGIMSTGKDASSTSWTHSNSMSGNKFGLSASQVSYIWTPASNPKITKEIHSIVTRPSNFDKSKKYPVAYFIHGGPQGSWSDSWSTRWNPAVFAEQGYIVIAPNPTGSTGYGQALTDAIRYNWGGDPYQDIVNCFDWVGENMPEADNERAVALGASYGGYMMNWIQGQPLGRKFKALVCHDGILSFSGSMISTDELYFTFHDLGATPWYDPGSKTAPADKVQPGAEALPVTDWKRWDPSEYLEHWATPQLVIHNSQDYRLAISDGLAAFNVLQARGVESEFLTFPDENHWVLKPENSLVWHKVVLNWINKYVGLPPYTTEDPDSDEFWGGVREEKAEPAQMPAQGKPET
ncbi:hypothetical protein LTR53_001027 [Teratosphaeriaceae sp. CCFEE 6253]|nr:hypothetical protein LTR53_001027 [Teratosphaeriaceae sp. CCFEE 6253]